MSFNLNAEILSDPVLGMWTGNCPLYGCHHLLLREELQCIISGKNLQNRSTILFLRTSSICRVILREFPCMLASVPHMNFFCPILTSDFILDLTPSNSIRAVISAVF